MKLDELRQAIKGYTIPELTLLVAELYKLVPKAKKEETDIDNYIRELRERLNNKEVKVLKKEEQMRDIEVIAGEISLFIEHAKNQYYLFSNKVISKKDRSNWRFKVKNWHKEICINAHKDRENLLKYANLLGDLYDILCQACHYQLFSGDNPFRSVGIEQDAFLRTVLQMSKQATTLKYFMEKGIARVVLNATNNEMLHTHLILIFIEILTEGEFYIAIEVANELRKKISFSKELKGYAKQSANNRTVEMVFHIHAALDDFQNAIAYFKSYYIYEKEILTYCLIRELFKYKAKTEMLQVLLDAEKEGIKLRDSLIKLKKHIQENDDLPKYF